MIIPKKGPISDFKLNCNWFLTLVVNIFKKKVGGRRTSGLNAIPAHRESSAFFRKFKCLPHTYTYHKQTLHLSILMPKFGSSEFRNSFNITTQMFKLLSLQKEIFWVIISISSTTDMHVGTASLQKLFAPQHHERP